MPYRTVIQEKILSTFRQRKVVTDFASDACNACVQALANAIHEIMTAMHAVSDIELSVARFGPTKQNQKKAMYRAVVAYVTRRFVGDYLDNYGKHLQQLGAPARDLTCSGELHDPEVLGTTKEQTLVALSIRRRRTKGTESRRFVYWRAVRLN